MRLFPRCVGKAGSPIGELPRYLDRHGCNNDGGGHGCRAYQLQQEYLHMRLHVGMWRSLSFIPGKSAWAGGLPRRMKTGDFQMHARWHAAAMGHFKKEAGRSRRRFNIRKERNGAGGEDRTPDLRFTKPLHYRCATPAGVMRAQVAAREARRKFHTNVNIKCSSAPKPTPVSGIVRKTWSRSRCYEGLRGFFWEKDLAGRWL